MHFAARNFLSTYFYAFRAKREKKVMYFFNILCNFGQTLKNTGSLTELDKNDRGPSPNHDY